MSETDYDSRFNTSISDDIDEYVPEDAEPLWGDGDPTDPVIDPIFVTEQYAYNTGVHCRQCYCDVARTDRETGVVTCPNCGWSSDADREDWADRATELRERGGVPRRQAEVVALRETGLTHTEISDVLDLSGRGNVSTFIDRYVDRLAEADYLADHGPLEEDLRGRV